MFRNGWQMDYPSIENFLTPIYAKGADSNDARTTTRSSTPSSKAAAAPTADEANALYQEAEAILVNDFPAFRVERRRQSVGPTKVTNVTINAFGVPGPDGDQAHLGTTVRRPA